MRHPGDTGWHPGTPFGGAVYDPETESAWAGLRGGDWAPHPGYTGGPYDVPPWTVPRRGNRMAGNVRLPPGWRGWTRTPISARLPSSNEREQTVRAAAGPVPLCYGAPRVGGNIELLHQQGSKIYAVVSWCIGEIEEITTVDFGGDTNGYQIGGLGSTDALGTPTVEASYTGTLTQTVDSTLAALAGIDWFQRLPGRAYSVLSIDTDEDASLLEEARATLKGLRVYDPRTASTAYSRTPVLLGAAIIAESWGWGLGSSAVDWDRIEDAADYCETTVNGQPRFAVDVWLRREMSVQQLMDTLGLHCRGYWGEGANGWYMDVERPVVTATFTFTDQGANANVVPQSVEVVGPDRTDMLSRVEVRYTDADNDWTEDHIELDVSSSRTGNRVARIDLPWCTNRDQALRVAHYEKWIRQRNPDTVTWLSDETAYDVSLGDRVTFTGADILDEQDLLIMKRTRQPDGQIRFVGTEYETAAYSDEYEDQDTPPSYTSPSASDPPSGTFDREEVNDWSNDWKHYNYFILSWTKPSSDGDYAMEAWVDDGSGNYELWAWVPSGLEEMILAPDYYLEDDHSPYHLNEIHGAVPTNSLKMYLRNKATNQRTEWTIDNDVELSLPDFYDGNTSTGAAAHFAGTEASDREYSRGGVTSYTAGSDDTISTASEAGLGPTHQTTLTIDATNANDYDLADGDHGAGKKVYEFPAGRILLLGATCNLVCTSGGDITDEYSVAVGTATAGDDATLTGTEADVIDVMTVGDGADQDAHGEDAGSIGYYDGTSTATALYLNTAIADASNTGAGTVEITGTIVVSWVNLGDY